VNWLAWVGGIIAVIELAIMLRRGQWRIVVPVIAWLAITLPLAGAFDDAALRGGAVVVSLAGALVLARWTRRHFGSGLGR
jgi:hypothetical protein